MPAAPGAKGPPRRGRKQAGNRGSARKPAGPPAEIIFDRAHSFGDRLHAFRYANRAELKAVIGKRYAEVRGGGQEYSVFMQDLCGMIHGLGVLPAANSRAKMPIVAFLQRMGFSEVEIRGFRNALGQPHVPAVRLMKKLGLISEGTTV